MKNTFNSLCISLPEDIKKAKYHGDFKRAIRLIDMHLQSDKTATCMKERLAFEKLVLKTYFSYYAQVLLMDRGWR